MSRQEHFQFLHKYNSGIGYYSITLTIIVISNFLGNGNISWLIRKLIEKKNSSLLKKSKKYLLLKCKIPL